MEQVITCYGGGKVFYYIFNALAAMTGSKSGFFMNMLHISAVIGAFYALILMLYNHQIEHGIRWFFWVLFVTNVVLLPKGTIFIHDPISNTRHKVDHVPLMLGVFASTVSQVGKEMTEKFESLFTLPDYLPYHKTGTVFASSLMQQLRHFRIVDADYKGNMERFVNQCVVYDAMIGHKYTLNDLQNSTDIWKLVSEKASPVLGFLYKVGNSPGEIVTCKQGAILLQKKWNEELTKAIATYGNRVNHQTLSKSAFLSHLQISYQLLTNISQDAESLLRQEVMINAIEDASHNKLSELGNGNHYASTKSLLQQRSAYETVGEIAAKTLPLFKTVIEALSYAIFIFVMILALLPNGHKVIMTYCGILIWTQLWTPLYAVLNLIMTLYGKYESMSLIGTEGLNMVTSSALYHANQDITTLAAWLSMSIPFLSYGILKQGVGAFVGIAQSLNQGVQSIAASAANEAISGNLSLANVSMGVQAYQNKSAYQHNTSPSYSSSQIEALGVDGVRQVVHGSGNQSFQDQSLSQLGIQIMASTNNQQSISESLNNARSLEERWGEAYSKAQESAIQQTSNFMKQMAKEVSSGRDFGQDLTTSQATSIRNIKEIAENLSKNAGMTEEQAFEAIASASLGIGKRLGSGIGANIDGSFKSSAHRNQAIQEAHSFAKQQGHAEDLSNIKQLSQRLHEGNRDSHSTQLAKSMNASLNKLESARQEYSLAKNQVETLSHELSSTKNSGFSTTRDVTQEVLEYIVNSEAYNSPLPGDKIGYREARSIMQRGGPEFAYYLENYRHSHPEIEGISIGGSIRSVQSLQEETYNKISEEMRHNPQPSETYQKYEQALDEKAKMAHIHQVEIPSHALQDQFGNAYERAQSEIGERSHQNIGQEKSLRQELESSQKKNLAWEAGANVVSPVIAGAQESYNTAANYVGEAYSKTVDMLRGAFNNKEQISSVENAANSPSKIKQKK